MVFTGRRYEIINDADEMNYPPQELYDLLYKNENKKQDNNKNKVNMMMFPPTLPLVTNSQMDKVFSIGWSSNKLGFATEVESTCINSFLIETAIYK